MLGFMVILTAVLLTVLLFFAYMLRYIVSAAYYRRAAGGMLLLSVLLALGVYGLRRSFSEAWLAGCTEFLAMLFMAEFLLAALTLLAVLVRGFYRRLLRVPFDSSRRRLLQRSLLYPAAAAGAAAYGGLWERRAAVEREFAVAVPGLPEESSGLRIAQLSDVHLGMFFSLQDLQELLTRTAASRPALLVLTGDIFDDDDKNEEAIRMVDSFTDRFPLGICYIYGNHEHMRRLRRIQAALHRTRIRVLDNAHVRLTEGSMPLVVAGVDYPFPRDHFAALAKAYTAEAMEGIPSGALTVLLAHHPDFFDEAVSYGVQLVLSGHTHGGQIGLFGVPLVPPLFRYMRGWYTQGQTKLYVHSGNGSWFPYRLGCPPEIAYFRFERA